MLLQRVRAHVLEDELLHVLVDAFLGVVGGVRRQVRLPLSDSLGERFEGHLSWTHELLILLVDLQLTSTAAAVAHDPPGFPGALAAACEDSAERLARGEVPQVVVELVREVLRQRLVVDPGPLGDLLRGVVRQRVLGVLVDAV